MIFKRTLSYCLIITSLFLLGNSEIKAQNNPDFYVENGICKCPNANFGDTGTVTLNNTQSTFTKRTKSQLQSLIDNNPSNQQIFLTCTTGITDMSNLFGFTQLSFPIDHWDTSNVTDMSYMFQGTTSSSKSFNNWDVSNVTNMTAMFYNADFSPDVDQWDVSNVTSMKQMFRGANKFFNDIGSWNVSSVTTMESMFRDNNVFDQNLNGWNVSNITDMGLMFYQADAFDQPLNNWDVGSVTNMSGMFFGASSFNQPLNNWNVSNVANMGGLFYNSSFNQDISNWCVDDIASEPTNFDDFSPLTSENTPNWGAICENIWRNGSEWSLGEPESDQRIVIEDDGNPFNYPEYFLLENVNWHSLRVEPNAEIFVKKVLSIANDIENNGDITFASNNISSGQLGEFNGNITGSGTIKVRRFIPAEQNNRRAFRFVTSAVNSDQSIFDNWQEEGLNIYDTYGTHITGSTEGLNGLDATSTGNPSMFTFDNTYSDLLSNPWNPVLDTKNNNLVAGKAYRLLIRGDRQYNLNSYPADPPNSDVILRAEGDLITGNHTVSLNSNENLFSFVGNPYQAIVNINDVVFNNIYDNFYWLWDPNLSQRGAYVVVNLPFGNNFGSSEANQFIQPGQAFFVQTSSDGPASITFTESSKDVSQSSTEVFSENNQVSLELLLYNKELLNNGGNESDALAIMFSQSSNDNVDDNDAVKMENPDENLARLNDDKLLSIENRSMPKDGEYLDLYVDGYTTDDYKFDGHSVNFPNDVNAFLVDHYTGEQTLINNNQYHFSVDLSSPNSAANDRFSIKFEKQNLNIDDNDISNDVKVYPNPVTKELATIKSSQLSGKEVTFSLHDIKGQSIYEADKEFKNNGECYLDLGSVQNGVYIIKLSHKNKSIDKKLIIYN